MPLLRKITGGPGILRAIGRGWHGVSSPRRESAPRPLAFGHAAPDPSLQPPHETTWHSGDPCRPPARCDSTGGRAGVFVSSGRDGLARYFRDQLLVAARLPAARGRTFCVVGGVDQRR